MAAFCFHEAKRTFPAYQPQGAVQALIVLLEQAPKAQGGLQYAELA